MKVHKIKIWQKFADQIASGKKTFEIRKNDRCYKRGDYIEFQVVTNDKTPQIIEHALNNLVFEITYVIAGFGLEEGYVVFSIKRIN